jgi:hypothetical protein
MSYMLTALVSSFVGVVATIVAYGINHPDLASGALQNIVITAVIWSVVAILGCIAIKASA